MNFGNSIELISIKFAEIVEVYGTADKQYGKFNLEALFKADLIKKNCFTDSQSEFD